MGIKPIYSLLKETFDEWNEDKVPRLGAALAYYSVFSIAPLMIIAIGVAGLVFGPDSAQKDILGQVEGTVGQPVAAALQKMLASSDNVKSTSATIIGVVTLLFAAAGVFGQLQDSLDTVWKVTPKPGRGIWGFIRDRFLSLTMVLGTGFLLLVSLILSTVLTAMGTTLSNALPGGAVLWQVVNFVVSFVLIAFLFALIYKYIPDARIGWRDVWIGAVLTAALFTLGKFLLGWYLAQESTTSAYGAAGSLVVILLWVYYASQILLFGAEFTRIYASRYGSGLKPAPNAMLVSAEARARQGIVPEAAKEHA